MIRMPAPRTTQELQALALQEKKHALKILNDRRGQVNLATELVTSAARRLDPMATELAVSARIECRRGCSWCCRGSRVDVTPPEAIAIANWICENLDSELQEDIRHRVISAAERVRTTTTDERWAEQIPCAFLSEQGVCEIHPIRPFACRRTNFYDASACERASKSGEGVPIDVQILALYGIGQVAIDRAARDCRLGAGKYELSNAVDLAMRVPDAAIRWAEGSKLFDAARTPNDTQDRIAAAEASAAINPQSPPISNRDDLIRATTEGRIPSMPPAIEESLMYGSPTAKNKRKRERRAKRN